MNTILTLFFIALFWVGLGALTHFLRIDFIEILKEENLPVNQRPLWQAVLAIILVKSAVTRTGKQLSECLDEREPKLTETFKKWPLIVVIALIRSLGILSLMKTRLHDLWQNNTMHKARKIRADNKKRMRRIFLRAGDAENKLDDLMEEVEEMHQLLKEAKHQDEELGEKALKMLTTLKNQRVPRLKDTIEKHRRLLEKRVRAVLEDEEIEEDEDAIKISHNNLFEEIESLTRTAEMLKNIPPKVKSSIRFA